MWGSVVGARSYCKTPTPTATPALHPPAKCSVVLDHQRQGAPRGEYRMEACLHRQGKAVVRRER